MNKRQSKKQEMQMQVDNIRLALNTNTELALKTSGSLKKTIDMSNENFKTVAKDLGKVDSILERTATVQEDILPEVIDNRFAILDIQKQLKYVNLNSIIHSIAIFALAVSLIWRW